MDSALNSALQKVEEVNHGNRALVLVEDGRFELIREKNAFHKTPYEWPQKWW